VSALIILLSSLVTCHHRKLFDPGTCCLIKDEGKVKLLILTTGHTEHPDIRVKHCAYDHSVATVQNPRDVTIVSHKYSLTVARHATVVVAVPCTVHYPANYKIKTII
jgi:hypothetical protein